MELDMGKVITAKRKEKSWTQEQLAQAVGVSTPAVSKWETGATYPDITLLPPIARALNTTVDELFSYQNELSDNEVSGFTQKATSLYEAEGFDAGWKYCQKLLQEFPNSIPLKFYLGNLFQSFMIMKIDLGKEDIQSYYRQAAILYEEVLLSGYPKFTYHATLILVGFYTMLNELDRAEELLDSLPKLKTDPDFLYPSIYALRGKNEEAMKLTQENIRRYVSRVSQGLSLLGAFAREQEDMDKACTLAQINLEITKLLGISREIAYADMIKIMVARGDKQAALTYLEEYTQHILELSCDYAKSPVFNRVTEKFQDPSYVKKVLAQSILIDKEYTPLKEEPRYLQIVHRLRQVIDTQTHTFRE